MEWLLLETVEWRIRVPSVLTFLRHYHHALANDPACDVVPNDAAAAADFKTRSSFLAVRRPPGLAPEAATGAGRAPQQPQ